MASKPVQFQVTLTDSSGRWFNGQISKMNAALNIMGAAILKDSQIKVPRKSGNLRDSARVISGNKQVAIVYPGPYGGYQERGERRDGSHKVRHYTSAGTGKNYLKSTGDAVVERGLRWFLSRS